MSFAGPSPSVRIDKWLWYARFAKTRAQAAQLCAQGAVELGGRTVAKPHQPVRSGMEITIVRGSYRHRVEVIDLGTRRGPAVEAQRLYRLLGSPEPLGPAPAWVPLLSEDAGL